MSSSQRFRDLLNEDSSSQPDAPQQAAAGSPRATTRGSLLEKRIEWLFWGLTVVFFGVSFILSTPENNRSMLLYFPLLAGGLLLTTAIIQRIGFNWRVSIFTWVLGVLLMSLGISALISFITSSPIQIAHYFGAVVVLAGVVILVQIFRQS